MLKLYYNLAKPGIIYGNAVAALAGFFLASQGYWYPKLLTAMLAGLSLIIASGCVFNNIADADIDSKMPRTKTRAMATGKISKKNARIYGAILLIAGTAVLALYADRDALMAALAGWLVYVFVYTPLKRRTVYAALLGAIAGATPPVVGYTSVARRFDSGALLLFLFLFFWQMPHFYGIALYRLEDYSAANIPVWPAGRGIASTKRQILLFIILFALAAAGLTYCRYTGPVYLIAMLILCVWWAVLAIKGFKATDYKLWGKKLFLRSLAVLTVVCVIISLDFIIH